MSVGSRSSFLFHSAILSLTRYQESIGDGFIGSPFGGFGEILEHSAPFGCPRISSRHSSLQEKKSASGLELGMHKFLMGFVPLVGTVRVSRFWSDYFIIIQPSLRTKLMKIKISVDKRCFYYLHDT